MSKLVQIIAGRDVNIYGCSGHAPALPSGSAPKALRDDAGFVWALVKFIGIATAACIVVPVLLAGALLALALLIGVCLGVGGVVVGFYLVCRVANGLLWVERSIGGGPTRLVYMPSLPVRMLGAGQRVDELDGINQLESDYVD